MSDFEAVYRRLRELMITAAPDHAAPIREVSTDEPGELIVRTTTLDPKTGEPGWFGTVTIKKSYVAYHLMPLYTDPELSATVSEALSRRRQGKTCFNFTKIDEELFDELSALTRRAYGD